MDKELFRGTRPQVMATDASDPDNRRIFVWAWTEWFERMEEDSGAVAFEHVGYTEEELRRWLAEQGEPELIDINDTELGRTVREEFLDQSPLYPEGEELSDEPPFGEQREEEWE